MKAIQKIKSTTFGSVFSSDSFGSKGRNGKEVVEKLIDWRKIGAIIQKNWIVLTRDKTRLIPLLVFPIIMMLVLGYTSGNTPKHINTAIVAYDESPLALSLEQQISGSQYFSVKYIVSNEGEARELLDAGKIRVIVEIPKGIADTVDAGNQGVVTVIVDESDSSVAGTSRQVLKSIIDSVATQISTQKLTMYKQSVGAAAQQMNAYALSFQNAYPTISSQSAGVLSALSQAKELTSQEIAAILANPVPPARITIHAGATITYQNQSYALENDTGYVLEPTTTRRLEAQAALLQQSIVFIDGATQLSSATYALSAQAAADTAQLQSTVYAQKMAASLSAIQVFTQSKTESTLRPLLYAEKQAYGTGRHVTDFLIPSLIATTIFQGAVMGMGRAVAGEKREGSLTRVFLTPTSNTTIIVGTLLFYVLFEMLRASFLIGVAIVLFDLKIVGSYLLIAIILAVYISISTAIGMVMSSMVRTEQQFMAMAMLVSLPTMFLSGVFFPVQAMPKAFQAIASFLPVTYASEGLRNVMVKGLAFGSIAYPLGILIIFLVVTYAGVVLVFKRDVE